jgi:hypothetical protein
VNNSPKAKARCLGPLAISALLLAALVAAVLIPRQGMIDDYRSSATDLAAQLAGFNSRLDQRPEIERAVSEVRSGNAIKRSYLQGQTVGLAGANLQEMTKNLIEKSGGELSSSQIVTPGSPPPLQKLVNRIRMRCDTATLLNLLHRIETNEPILLVENLAIRSLQRRNAQSELLDVQFDLVGYVLLRGDLP